MECPTHGPRCDPATDHLNGGLKMAGEIEIYQVGNEYRLRIDGLEFPWAIADGGVSLGSIGRSRVPTVELVLLAG
jgi:hypothetical protein